MILKATNIKKIFSQGNTNINAVNDVSFSVDKGESLAIIGKSGSGKTTLMSILTGLEQASSGTVDINSNLITSMSEKELALFRAQQIGIVFQQFHLIPHLTALENVSLALEIVGATKTKDKAAEALSLVGLSERLNHLPSKLSGGENQRVAIARAIVNQPQLLFADEPSGNLDLETGQKIMDLIFEICTQKLMTLVLITHDQQLAEKCNLQIQLRNGQII